MILISDRHAHVRRPSFTELLTAELGTMGVLKIAHTLWVLNLNTVQELGEMVVQKKKLGSTHVDVFN